MSSFLLSCSLSCMKTDDDESLLLREVKNDTEQIINTSAIKQDTSQIQSDLRQVLFEISQLHLAVQSRSHQLGSGLDSEPHNHVLERYLWDLKTDAETVLGDPDYLEDLSDGENEENGWAEGSNVSELSYIAGHDQRDTKKGKEVATSPIIFTNSQGRRYPIPIDKCKTWAVSGFDYPLRTFTNFHVFQDMSKLIQQSFAHRDASEGRDIIDGRYDLLGPDGGIVLQSLWESLVSTGWQVTMKLWEPTATGNNSKLPIRFKDAIGRKYGFPFHKCATWEVCLACPRLPVPFRHSRPSSC